MMMKMMMFEPLLLEVSNKACDVIARLNALLNQDQLLLKL